MDVEQQQQENQQQEQINIPYLEQRRYEVKSQYEKRKAVYEIVFKDLKNANKAICYSNIYANIKFLGNTYSDEITKKVMDYADQLQ